MDAENTISRLENKREKAFQWGSGDWVAKAGTPSEEKCSDVFGGCVQCLVSYVKYQLSVNRPLNCPFGIINAVKHQVKDQEDAGFKPFPTASEPFKKGQPKY
jgi:hypothetical protein